MAIRNTSHDGPCACLTSPECNSVKILRMPNLRAVPAACQKSLATLNDMRMLGRERERKGLYYFSHLCTIGASISINIMNFALICKDRTAISLNLCKIQEFPRLES